MSKALNLSLCVIVSVLVSCVSNGVNVVRNGTVHVVREHSKHVEVSSAYVYQEGTETIISGNVSLKPSAPHATIHGHVDITISNAEGRIVAQTSTECGYLSCHQKKAAFEASLPLVLPQGSEIRVVHHASASSCWKRAG